MYLKVSALLHRHHIDSAVNFPAYLHCQNSSILDVGIFRSYCWLLGLPGNSAGKESACNAGDPGSFPGLGRSAREGIGYSLQYSLASLMTQLIKNLPAMWETWVQSLGWEDPLRKGTDTHSSSLAWRIPGAA